MMPNHIRAQRSVASRPHHRDRRLPAASEGENTVGTTHISTAETTIGNNDSAIIYAGEWFTNSDPDSTGEQSLHGTRAANSNAKFIFNGTFVAAYGAVDQSGASFTYTIDDGSAMSVTFPAKNPPESNFALFTSPELDYGEHTLLLSTSQDGPTLWLDYITYTGSELVRRLDPQVDAAPQQSTQTLSPQNNALPAGTIVLIVLCSILFVVVAVIAGILLHRRRHRWQLNSPEHDTSAKENGLKFDILPPSTEREGVHRVEAIRVKILAALRSRSRTQPGMPRQPPRSSTLFTSVIMPPSSVSTSRR